MSSVTFNVAVGGDGSTVTDDNNATTGLRDGGWKTRFVPCFTQQVAVANYVVNTALTVLGGATTNSTSTTSLAIGTGSKSLTLIESGKAYIVGQYVVIASTASPSNNMVGQITSFSGTSLVVNVTTINGSGTISAWSISVTSAGSYLPLAGGTMTGAITFAAGQAFTGTLPLAGGTMTGTLTLDAYTEKVATLATSGSIALNPSTGTTLSCAAAGTITFTDSLSSGQSISLLITNGSSYTINWPTTTWVTAAGNTAPTLSASNTLVFWKISTTLYGALVGKSA